MTPRLKANKPLNILVLCTGNSARSILLESLFNHRSKGRINAYSAGSNPSGQVQPNALKLLKSKGHDITTARSKSWDEFSDSGADNMDIVITVCGNAASEICPVWPNSPLKCHWGVDDPAGLDMAAFQVAYDVLGRRADLLLALNFEDMNAAKLKPLLDQIGTQ